MAEHLRHRFFVASGLLALLMSACTHLMNGPGAVTLPDGQVAIVYVGGVHCSIWNVMSESDGKATSLVGQPKHADRFRLTPGRYVIVYECMHGTPNHSQTIQRGEAVDLKPGHVYQVRSSRNPFTHKPTAWIEDHKTGEVVAGKK